MEEKYYYCSKYIRFPIKNVVQKIYDLFSTTNKTSISLVDIYEYLRDNSPEKRDEYKKEIDKPIYIFGHKNPDTDSVCGAIALSYLKNHLGMNTTPAVLGNINNETKYALDTFGFKHIYRLNDVKLQIKDVDYLLIYILNY